MQIEVSLLFNQRSLGLAAILETGTEAIANHLIPNPSPQGEGNHGGATGSEVPW
ncbi:hypothetical protein [Pedobacter sp. SYSU D00535]|uniref:hypothetical protein n=1 Tax=Pedobacter sp. SYSU D00535 TaxID=2810308 RepID=UPI001A95D963|nr:hypothetical protein [Pedobacter sp. SYSU D00535]